MQLTKRIEGLMGKAGRLVAENRRLVQRQHEMQQEIDDLKRKWQHEQQKAQELNNQIKIVKLAQNIGGGNAESVDIKELKQKLNEYIKEIDSCVAMLNV